MGFARCLDCGCGALSVDCVAFGLACHPEPPEVRSRAAAERRRTVEGPPFLKPGWVEGLPAGGPSTVLSPSGASAAQDDSAAVGKNRGFCRPFDACSNAYANLINDGSLHAPAKNEIPTGNPKARPAGTVMCG